MEIHNVQPALLLFFAQVFVVFRRVLGQLMKIRQKLLFFITQVTSQQCFPPGDFTHALVWRFHLNACGVMAA